MTETRRSDEARIRLIRRNGAGAEPDRRMAGVFAQQAIGVPAACQFGRPQRKGYAEDNADQDACQESPHEASVARRRSDGL